jgi:hypothetical protein
MPFRTQYSPSASATFLFLLAGGLVFAASVGCRTRRFSDSAAKSGASASPSGVDPSASGPLSTAFDPDSLTGQELWNLTEKNVFNAKVHVIEIKMNEASYASLYNDEKAAGCSSTFEGKTAHVRSFRFDDVEMNNVGIKVRGNTSVCIPRLQFTLKFDKGSGVVKKERESDQWNELDYSDEVKKEIKKQTLYGLDEISLRRSQNDSSAQGDYRTGALVREFVSSWAIARTEDIARTTLRGAPVYRVSYAKVLWRLCENDADKACKKTFAQVYNVAENINKTFFKMRWDDEEPTVFQHNKACGFKPGSAFSVRCYDPAYVEGEKFDETDSKLLVKAKNFIEGPTGLMTRLAGVKSAADYEALVDTDAAMNLVMGSSLVAHWDSAIGNFNNDVVYFHKPSGKWKFVVWDLDNTHGQKSGASFHFREVAGNDRPLFEPLVKVGSLNTEFKNRFQKYLQALNVDRNEGPWNEKIIEARDCFVGELNNVRPGQEKSGTLDAREAFLKSRCAGIWSTSADRASNFLYIPDSEKQETSLVNSIFDFRRARYLKLTDELR